MSHIQSCYDIHTPVTTHQLNYIPMYHQPTVKQNKYIQNHYLLVVFAKASITSTIVYT